MSEIEFEIIDESEIVEESQDTIEFEIIDEFEIVGSRKTRKKLDPWVPILTWGFGTPISIANEYTWTKWDQEYVEKKRKKKLEEKQKEADERIALMKERRAFIRQTRETKEVRINL